MSDVLVLCYHGVSATWPADISVTPEQLERQVAGLLRRGYRPATFTDAVLGRSAHRRTLAVTFDDAYRNVLDIARPLLAGLGVPATVFAPTDHVATGAPMSWPGVEQWHGGPHEHELTGMGWEGLGVLRDDGWEIGSHTCTHPHLARIGAAARQEELERSRTEIRARLGVPCTSIAYPYGNTDAAVIDATRAAGYEAAGAVSSPRPNAPLDWPRIGIWSFDRGLRFHLKTFAPARRLRARTATPRYPDE